ncbi:MAG: hypothetical protein SGILL_006827, partial [Bacillariaceae sp.]
IVAQQEAPPNHYLLHDDDDRGGERTSVCLDYEDPKNSKDDEEEEDDDFSVDLDDNKGERRLARRIKIKNRQKKAVDDAATKPPQLAAEVSEDEKSDPERGVSSKVHSYRLEEWVTSSEEADDNDDDNDDECSDMISEDYSRQQRDAVLSTERIRREEQEDVIFNMLIVVVENRGAGGNKGDGDDTSSLSSLNSSFHEVSSLDQDILSDSEHAPEDDQTKLLLGDSYRSTGSEDQHVLFSQTVDNAETETLKKHPFDSPQGVSRLVLNEGGRCDDHSVNDGNDDNNAQQEQQDEHHLAGNSKAPLPPTRLSPHSIRTTSSKSSDRPPRRKARRSPRSPNSIKTPPSKSKPKRKLTPLWSPTTLPFGDERSTSKTGEDSEQKPSPSSIVRSGAGIRENNFAAGNRQQYSPSQPPQPAQKEYISVTSPVKAGVKEEAMVSSPDAFFSPESQGRTFLPKCFQSDMNATKMDLPLPLAGNGRHSSRSESFDDISSFAETATTSSINSSSGLEYLDENGNRPAFVSDVEHTAPLVDKSELPATKTKKSLNRKRSFAQPEVQEAEKVRNNMLLGDLLSSSSLNGDQWRNSTTDEASKGHQTRGASVSCGSVARSHNIGDRDDSDDFSIMSEISADSIHRNVQVKRTNRKKKSRKGKQLNGINPTTLSNTTVSNNESASNANSAKKKKAAKKARPRKRGRKRDFQSAGDATDETKSEDDLEDTKLPAKVQAMEMEERIDAIMNDKDLIYSEIDKKVSMIASILHPRQVKAEEPESKPKSMRIRSKANVRSSGTDVPSVSSQPLDRARSIIRRRSKSRTRGKSADGLREKWSTRSRSNSLDPTATANSRDQDFPMRGKRKSVVASNSSDGQAETVVVAGNRQKESNSDLSGTLGKERRNDPNIKNGKQTKSPSSIKEVKDLLAHARAVVRSSSRVEPGKEAVSEQGLAKGKSPSGHKRRVSKVLSPRNTRSKDLDRNLPSSGNSVDSKSIEGFRTVLRSPSKLHENRTTRSQRSQKELVAEKRPQVKAQTTTQAESIASRLSPPQSKNGRAVSKGSKSKSSKTVSPKLKSKLDKDIAEALQRHNLGSAVSTLMLGSPVPSSPSSKSKKDTKKRTRLEKQRSRRGLTNDVALSLIATKEDTNTALPSPSEDDMELKRTRELSAKASIPEIKELLPTANNGNDDKLPSTDIEMLMLQVKRTKKETKQKIFAVRSQTEEEILNMEHELEHRKAELLQKLISLNVESNPAEGIKYLSSIKVAGLHEKGKRTREEIKKLEEAISDQVSLTNFLIEDSVDVQKKTTKVVSEISRVELRNTKYTTAMNALRLAHSSVSDPGAQKHLSEYDRRW